MLQLTSFGHKTTSTMKFESRDKDFVDDVMDKKYDVISFISKYRCFKNV